MKKRYLWIIPAVLLIAGAILTVILLQKPKITEIEAFAATGDFNYYLGEEFDLYNINVKIKYSDGSVKDAKKEDYDVDKSAYKKDIPGTYDIIVKLKNSDKSYTIKAVVLNLSVTEITLSGYKNVFEINEDFATGNLVVTKKLNNNSTDIATASEYTVDSSAFKKGTAGVYAITVKLKNSEISASYNVTVNSASNLVTEITLSLYKDIFENGEDFSVGGLIVTKKFSDNSTAIATASEYTVDSSAFKKGTAGVYAITVKLKNSEISASYNVTVNDAATPELLGLEIKNIKPIYSLEETFELESIKVYKVYNFGLPVLAEPEEYMVSTDFTEGIIGDYAVRVSLADNEISKTQNIKISSISKITDENGGKVSYDIQTGWQVTEFKYLPKLTLELNNPEYTFNVLINTDNIFINGKNTAFITVYTDDTKNSVVEEAEINFNIDFSKIGWLSLNMGVFKNQSDHEGFLLCETLNSQNYIYVSFSNPLNNSPNFQIYLTDNTPLDHNLILNPGDNKVLIYITTSGQTFLLKVNIKLIELPLTEIMINGVTKSITENNSTLDYIVASKNEVTIQLNLDMQSYYYEIYLQGQNVYLYNIHTNEITFPLNLNKCSGIYVYIYMTGYTNYIENFNIEFKSNITDISVNGLQAYRDYANIFTLSSFITEINNITINLNEDLTYTLLLDGEDFDKNKLYTGINNIYIQIKNSNDEIIETAVLRLTSYLYDLNVVINSTEENLELVKTIFDDKTYYTTHVSSRDYDTISYTTSSIYSFNPESYTFTLLNLNGESAPLALQPGANYFLIKIQKQDFAAFARVCIYYDYIATDYIDSLDILINNQNAHYDIYRSDSKGYYLGISGSPIDLHTSKIQKIYFKQEYSQYTYTYETTVYGYSITLLDEEKNPVLIFELFWSSLNSLMDNETGANFFMQSFTGEKTSLKFNDENYLELQVSSIDCVAIELENYYALIEISANDSSLFTFQNRRIYFKGVGELLLSIKVTSTDLSMSNIYTIKLNIVSMPILKAQIGDYIYSSVAIRDSSNTSFYGDFKFKTDRWGNTSAVLLYLKPEDVNRFIKNNTLNVTITVFDFLSIYYDGNIYDSTCNLSLPILFDGIRFYATYSLIVSNTEKIPVYFIFDDAGWDVEITFGNNEQSPLTFSCPDIYTIYGSFMGMNQYFGGIPINRLDIQTIDDGYVNINLKLSDNTTIKTTDENGQEKTYTNETNLTGISSLILYDYYNCPYILLECTIQGYAYLLIIMLM